MTWQAIATAPGAEMIWLFSPDDGQHSGMFYDGMWLTILHDEMCLIQPTHWQPLPEPPHA